MTIKFKCSQCNKTLKAPDNAAGKNARCKCGATIMVPEPGLEAQLEEIDEYALQPAAELTKPNAAPPPRKTQSSDDYLVLQATVEPLKPKSSDERALEAVLGADWKNAEIEKDDPLIGGGIPDDASLIESLAGAGVGGGIVGIFLGSVMMLSGYWIFAGMEESGIGFRLPVWLMTLGLICIVAGGAGIVRGLMQGKIFDNEVPQRLDIKTLLAIGGVTVLAAIGLIAVLLLLSGSTDEGGRGVAANRGANAKAKKTPFAMTEFFSKGNFVTIDASKKNSTAEPAPFEQLPDGNTPLPRAASGIDLDITGDWGITLGPRPDWGLSPKLEFPETAFRYVKEPKSKPRVVIADVQGPFAIRPSKTAWSGVLYELDRKKRLVDKVDPAYIVHPQPDHEVVDLRTAEVIGNYSHLLPIWLDVRLSPNAQWAVSPDPVPASCKDPEHRIYVWRIDQTEAPTNSIHCGGVLNWFSFISEDRIAFIHRPEDPYIAKLAVWDLASHSEIYSKVLDREFFDGKRLTKEEIKKQNDQRRAAAARIRRQRDPRRRGPMDKTDFETEEGSAQVTYKSNDLRSCVRLDWYNIAISDDGKYLFDGRRRGFQLVRLEDGEILARVAQRKNERVNRVANPDTFLGAYFDSKTNVVWALRGESTRQIMAFSLDDGRIMNRSTLSRMAGGRLMDGPLPGTKVLNRGSFDTRFSDVIRTDGQFFSQIPKIITWRPDNSRLLYGQNLAKRARRIPVEYYVVAPDKPPEASLQNRNGMLDSLAGYELEISPRTKPPTNAAEQKPTGETPAFITKRNASSLKKLPLEWPRLVRAKAAYSLAEEDNSRLLKHTSNESPEEIQLPLKHLAAEWAGARRPLGAKPPRAFAISTDEHRLATGSKSPQIQIVDLATKKITREFRPYEGTIDWFDFGAQSDSLWTVGGGRLTHWRLESGEVVKEYDGGYSGKAAWGPQQEWLVVPSATTLDVYDASSGSLIRRFATHAKTVPTKLVVAPSGRFIAAQYLSRDFEFDPAHPLTIEADRSISAFHQIVVLVLDLQASKTFRRSVRLRDRRDDPRLYDIGFVGGEHLAISTKEETNVYDLKLQKLVVAAPRLQIGADGSMWVRDSDHHRRTPFPHPEVLLAENRRSNYDPKVRFQLEVDLIEDRYSKMHAGKLAQRFAEEGIAFGPGAYVARLTARTKRGTKFVESNWQAPSGQRRQVDVPDIVYTWKILDPAGKEIHSQEVTDVFPMGMSKYYEGEIDRKEDIKRPLGEFKFPDNPTMLMAKEILTRGDALKQLKVPEAFRSSMSKSIQAGDKSVAVPAKIDG